MGWKLALLTVTGSLLIGCGSDTVDSGTLLAPPTVVASLTTTQLDALSSGAGLEALTGAARCDVTLEQINYRTTGVAGEPTNASAALMIPKGANCPGPFPLLAFARGTDVFKLHTVADPTNAPAVLLMIFFAGQGYVVVATDYLGYALSDYPYHPYMHATTEATAIIDSIRAVQDEASSLGLTLNGKLMISGYSQGGHSAMAAVRAIEQADSGEFNLVAAAGLAGAYAVSEALVHGATAPITGVQLFVPFQITAYQKIYGDVYSDASTIFKAPYDGYVDNLLPTLLTAAELEALLPQGTPAEAQAAMYQPAYLVDMATNSNNPTIVAARKQDLLDWTPKAPVMLCGGSGDPTVDFAVNAQAAFDGFHRRGANVTLVDVNSEIQAAFGSTLDAATIAAEYHGKLEPPFCADEAKRFLDLYK